MQYLSSLVSFRKNLIDCYRKGISEEVVDAMRRPGQQHSHRNCPPTPKPIPDRTHIFLPTLFYYQLVITEANMTPSRITVMLIDEILGYRKGEFD